MTSHLLNHRFHALALGMILLFTGVYITVEHSWRAQQSRFMRQVHSLMSMFRLELDRLQEELGGASEFAFHAQSENQQQRSFTAYAKSVLKRNPHIQGLMYISRLNRQQREQFELSLKKYSGRMQILDYQSALPAPIKDSYFPVKYHVSSVDTGTGMAGVDLATHADFNALIRQTANGDKMIVTTADSNPLQLLLLNSIHDRQTANVAGYTAMMVDLTTLLSSLSKQHQSDISIGIKSFSAQSPSLDRHRYYLENAHFKYLVDHFATVGQQPITMTFFREHSWTEFVSTATVGSLAGGILVTLLLLFLAEQYFRGRRRLVELVAQRTLELDHEKMLLELEIDQRLRAENESLFMQTVIDETFNGIFLIDATAGDFTIAQANEGAAGGLGTNTTELKGSPFCRWLDTKSCCTIERNLKDIAAGKISKAFNEIRMIKTNGETFPAEARMQLSTRALTPTIVVITQNISDRLNAELLSKKLSSAIEHTGDSVMITDKNGIIEYVNPAFEQITGYPFSEAVGKTPAIVRSNKHTKSFYQNLWATILRGEVFREILTNRKKSGELYYEEKTITALKNGNGAITHFVSTGKDITERMQTQKHLQFLAHHDTLTELPNRALFIRRLNLALDNAVWSRSQLAVLFVDLDRFKLINDTLGHNAGDELLRTFAQRIKSCVRHGDTVARLGGDEFTILLDNLKEGKHAKLIAEKILDLVNNPLVYNGFEFFVTASIGISVYPGDGRDAMEMIRKADTAMYVAKKEGKNNFKFYSAEMTGTGNQLSMEAELHTALNRQEFRVFYQPQTDILGNRITGMEALLRWQHPKRGLVTPNEFIPLLEETGLIVPVGEWLLNRVCHDYMRLKKKGLVVPRIAVNLSQRQLNHPNIVRMVQYSAENAGTDPKILEMEITENIMMENADANIETIRLFQALGISVAIDDFGTGYSSLSYIKKLPIETLKIDRMFIKDIDEDNSDKTIVSAVIAMAKHMNLKVVAEGVENAAQLSYLQALSCDSIQGFYISKPQPVEALAVWLSTQRKIRQRIFH